MAKSGSRVYRLDLAEFERYLAEKLEELKASHQQTQKVQKRLDAIFKREFASWQDVFGYCYPRLLTQRRELPAPLVSHIDQVEREELARIRQEIVDLGIKVTETRSKMDQLMQKGQDATGALRQENPGLNTEEEQLKALMVRFQDQYAEAFERMEGYESSTFGWLVHAFQISREKRKMREAKRHQEQTLKRLRKVRQDWLEKVESAGDTQAELREQWQKLSIEASEAQGQREHREANLETLAEQATIRRVLEELDQDYQVPDELGAKLVELVQRNRIREAYQTGLGAAAEAMGLMQGIGKGLARFHKSVGSVLREQKRHSLPKVAVMVPHDAALFNQTWKQFHEKIKNETYMAEHPLEFANLVERYFSQRMNDTTIKGFFETLGQALNQATKRWDK